MPAQDPQAARRHIDWVSEDNEPRRSYFFEYDGEDVWGLTLEFLFHFIEASKFGRIPFQWQLPNQPTWFDRSLL